MNNGFVQGGGWWVVGQFLLLLAIAILAIAGQATLKPLPLFIGGLVLVAVATLCSLAGLLALGRNLTPFPKPSAKTELVQHGIYALIRHPLCTSVFLCSRWIVTPLSKLAGLGCFRGAGGGSLMQSPSRGGLAAAAIPGLRKLRIACAAIHSMDLLNRCSKQFGNEMDVVANQHLTQN